MKASDSLSRIMGMDFFISFLFPNFGNVFFYSLPVPKLWELFFSFPSRSRIEGKGFFNPRTLGMELSIPVPVPELPNVIPAHPCPHSLLDEETQLHQALLRNTSQSIRLNQIKTKARRYDPKLIPSSCPNSWINNNRLSPRIKSKYHHGLPDEKTQLS